MGRLEGKVALITGAGSGFGNASARLMAREGAKVVVTDIKPENGQETVDRIKNAGGDAIFVRVDVGNLDDVQKAVDAAVETYGKLNILHCNAGIPGPNGIEGVTPESWDRAMAVLLRGGFFAVQYALPHMRKAGGGSIIFTSSVSGLRGSPASPTYSAAKGGMVIMAKSMALALAKEKIRVNTICPGAMMTPMLWEFTGRQLSPAERAQLTEEKIREWRNARIPMGRVADPEEVGWAAVFLASDEASYITGIELPVDGGLSAR